VQTEAMKWFKTVISYTNFKFTCLSTYLPITQLKVKGGQNTNSAITPHSPIRICFDRGRSNLGRLHSPTEDTWPTFNPKRPCHAQ